MLEETSQAEVMCSREMFSWDEARTEILVAPYVSTAWRIVHRLKRSNIYIEIPYWEVAISRKDFLVERLEPRVITEVSN